MDNNKDAVDKKGVEKFNEGVDATANFLKVVSLPVVKLTKTIRSLMPKKKTSDIQDEVTADNNS